MKTRSFLTAVYRIVRVNFEIICGDGGVHRTKTGISRNREESFAQNMARIFKRHRPNSMPIQCVFCLFVRAEAKEAITVMNGQAVCFDHTYYVQRGEFTKILEIVKRDEKRN